MHRHCEGEALQDFLDGIEVMFNKDKETVTLQEFNEHIDKRLKEYV
ncbi:hypothetical protein AGMMS50239_09480 [Bacteroidia bacterium]|nr:hypothetical protein AGMMS50239_09480 [Bacteroidia bacterium]